MATSSTNTTISNATSLTFQAWVNEIYTNLVTNCGLTQTADTGQMAVPCVTAVPAINTIGGYYIFRFNDTLQATSPVFIKMEFGQGGSATGAGTPNILITVGTSTNGAGTITGTAIARSALTNSNALISGTGTTNYVSRYCYNATQGFLGMAFKLGSTSTANQCYGGFFLYRTVDNTGAPTATGLNILLNTYNSTSGAPSTGIHAYIDYSVSVAGQLTTPAQWGAIPFNTASSIAGTSAQVFPVWQYGATASAPGYGVTNALAYCIPAEVSLNSTVTVTIVGSTSLTYINVGSPWAGATLGLGYSTATCNVLMLWQ